MVKPLRLKSEKVQAPRSRATQFPFARVLVDTGVAHLDQEFDFLVPQEMDSIIQAGSLVKVPFNSKKVLGVVRERLEQSSFQGEFKFITETVRPHPIITETTMDLVDAIKRRYGGTRWDVLRFCIPTLGKKDSVAFGEEAIAPTLTAQQFDTRYPQGFWKALSTNPKNGNPISAYWLAPPCEDPFFFLKNLIHSQKEEVLIIVPNFADVERLHSMVLLEELFAPEQVAVWHSEQSRSERESVYMRALNHRLRIVIGVRGALFLPLSKLSLIIIWDDINESLSEQQAPYFHAREVAIMKAGIEKTHLVIGGFSASLQSALYVKQGLIKALTLSKTDIRQKSLKVLGIDNPSAPNQSGRVPTTAWQTIKTGLSSGPVLVSVPLKGYIQALACAKCRNLAMCSCGGKLIWQKNANSAVCTVCNAPSINWSCSYCSGREFRHMQVGDQRIVEELGKAFPRVRIVSSNAEHPVRKLTPDPTIVVATPGMEPYLPGGYSAVVVLNSQLSLSRATIAAEEITRSHWFALATMIKEGGTIFVDSEIQNRNVQSLIRWDSLTLASNELIEREQLSLPPIVKTLKVSGSKKTVVEILRDLPDGILASTLKEERDGKVSAVLRITSPQSETFVEKILGRNIALAAKGGESARIAVDPISL
mgnify:CR=1 FL=1